MIAVRELANKIELLHGSPTLLMLAATVLGITQERLRHSSASAAG